MSDVGSNHIDDSVEMFKHDSDVMSSGISASIESTEQDFFNKTCSAPVLKTDAILKKIHDFYSLPENRSSYYTSSVVVGFYNNNSNSIEYLEMVKVDQFKQFLSSFSNFKVSTLFEWKQKQVKLPVIYTYPKEFSLVILDIVDRITCESIKINSDASFFCFDNVFRCMIHGSVYDMFNAGVKSYYDKLDSLDGAEQL